MTEDKVDRARGRRLEVLSAVVATLLALGALGWWFAVDPTSAFVPQVPGMDYPDGVEIKHTISDDVTIGEFFDSFDGTVGEEVGNWTGFRGPRHDNVVLDAPELATSWPEDGPPLLWAVDLGEGHAAPAVWKGRVYLLDYDEEERADALRCFSLADGSEIWRRWYRVKLKRNHGLSRTVPAVSDTAVVSIGPRGHVMAVDPISGDLLWTIDLEREWGAEAPFWYTGQCPLIDGDVVVLAPAGRALVIGVDLASGELLWQTPNPGGWTMSHTSVAPMQLDGQRIYVYSAIGGLVGVVAGGEEAGSVVFETRLWDHAVLAPSPLALPDDRLFLTAGYGAGSMVLQLENEGGQWTATEVARFKPDQSMASEQQTPILWRDHVYAILPKDGGERRQELVCYSPRDWTRPVWNSGTTERFGLGPYIVIGDTMLILDDDGVLTMIDVSANGYRRLARADILDGHDAWGPLAYAGGRLLARDSRRMVCVDLREGGG